MRVRSKLFQIAHPERIAAFQGYPGPVPLFPLGNQGPFLRSPAFEVSAKLAKEHGPLALLWIKSRPLVLISDERLALAVLSEGRDAFQLEAPAALLGLTGNAPSPLLEGGLGHSDLYRLGEAAPSLVQTPWLEEWLEERMPLLHADIAERSRAFARETQTGQRPLFQALLRIVFNSLTRLSLGQELGQQAFDDFLEFTLGKARKGLGLELHEDREDLIGTPLERLLQAIGKHISMAQRYPDPERKDLIGHLIEGRYALAEGRWAEAMLRVYLSTCLPIASALTSTMALLSTAPEALETLEFELDGVEGVPSLYTLLHLPVLDGVYREGHRLAPPVPLLGRRVKDHRQVDLAGHMLPAGTGVLIDLGRIQQSEEAWTTPERFDATRWQLQSGPLLEDRAAVRLAHGAAQLTNPTERLGEWMSKLVLFTWLREHTVLAGEGAPIAKQSQYCAGMRIPSGVLANVYPRGHQTIDATLLQGEQIPAPRALTLLKGSLRFGMQRRRKAQGQP